MDWSSHLFDFLKTNVGGIVLGFGLKAVSDWVTQRHQEKWQSQERFRTHKLDACAALSAAFESALFEVRVLVRVRDRARSEVEPYKADLVGLKEDMRISTPTAEDRQRIEIRRGRLSLMQPSVNQAMAEYTDWLNEGSQRSRDMALPAFNVRVLCPGSVWEAASRFQEIIASTFADLVTEDLVDESSVPWAEIGQRRDAFVAAVSVELGTASPPARLKRWRLKR